MAKDKKDRKPLGQTKFGMLMKAALPAAAGLIGDILPSNGAFGIVKNIIGKAVDKGEITPETADELMAEMQHEQEMYKTEVKDRNSAREREVAMAVAGRTDWMMNVSGIFALVASLAIVYVILFQEISDKELFYFVAGAVFTFAGQVMSYYFGSSKGSKDKDKFGKL